MTKIRNIFSNGARFGGKLGVVKIGSRNVCPDTIIAAAAGSAGTLTRAQMNLYDYFKVDDTTGSTDQFHLPAEAELGEQFIIYAVTAFEIHPAVTLSEINGTASFGFNTVAKSTYTCTKTAHLLDEWSVVAVAEAGTVTTLTINVAK